MVKEFKIKKYLSTDLAEDGREYKEKEFNLSNTTPNTCFVDLDILKHWEFKYGKKTYKLNVEEVIKLLKLVKGGKANESNN